MKKNFTTVDSFIVFMRASLRQALIHKLAHVKSAEENARMKAEDHLCGNLNYDQMLTLENTDNDIEKYETHAVRTIDVKSTVFLAGATNGDTQEVLVLKAAVVIGSLTNCRQLAVAPALLVCHRWCPILRLASTACQPPPAPPGNNKKKACLITLP